MTTQLELPIPTRAPEVSDADVELLCRRLFQRGWVFARQLREEFGYNDRALRAVAAASDGRVLSGQKGYRLLDGEAALEDAHHAAAWLESQGREMIHRATAIRRRAHRLLANSQA